MDSLTLPVVMVVVGLADVVVGIVGAKRRRPHARTVAMMGAAVAVCGAGQIIQKAAVYWLGSIIAGVGALGVVVAGVAMLTETARHRGQTSSRSQ